MNSILRLIRVIHRSWCPLVGIAASVCATTGCGQSSIWDMHLSQNRKAEAKEHWDNVRGSVKLQLAEHHLAAGRIEEAETVLEEALAVSPSDPKLFVLVTRLRLEQGRLAEARQAVVLAEALSSTDPEIPYLAGLVEQRYGDLETALEHFALAAQMSPNTAAYLMAQADTLAALDRPIDAMQVIQPRLPDFEQDADMRRLASRIARILGLRAPAIALAKDAVRISQNQPTMINELGLTLVWAGEYKQAIEVLKPLAEVKLAATDSITLSPDAGGTTPSPGVVHALARCYIETDQGIEAQRVLKLLIHSGQESSLTWHLFARAALLTNDTEGAARALAKANLKGATGPEDQILSAYVAMQRGDFESAGAFAQRAVVADQTDPLAHLVLGRASERMGRMEDARLAYEKALELDPDLVVAKQRLQLLSSAAENDAQ